MTADFELEIGKVKISLKWDGDADFNALIGVLESAKLELYRRMIAPYEDVKMKENGDCYAGSLE